MKRKLENKVYEHYMRVLTTSSFGLPTSNPEDYKLLMAEIEKNAQEGGCNGLSLHYSRLETNRIHDEMGYCSSLFDRCKWFKKE